MAEASWVEVEMALVLAGCPSAGKEAETFARAFLGMGQMDTWLEDRAWMGWGNTRGAQNGEASWT